MVTEHTNTVWNCADCGAPAKLDNRHGDWVHLDPGTLCPATRPITIVEVRLPVPARIN